MIPRFSVVLASVLTTGLLFGSLNLQAAPWYRVEVMLLAYQNPELIGDEQWPAAVPLPLSAARAPDLRWWHTPPVSGYNALLAGFGFSQAPVAGWDLPLQPLASLQLQAEAERLQKHPDIQVIWHQAWVEPIQEQEQAVVHPLDIRLTDKLDIQLSGSFSLHRSRFLHISTDLVVQHFQPTELSVLDDLTAFNSPVASTDRSDLLTQAAIASSAARETPPLPLRAAHLQQSRRMRSGELHYIDHPLLGIVVKVVPVIDSNSL